MINGPGRAYVERRGRLEPVVLDLDARGDRPPRRARRRPARSAARPFVADGRRPSPRRFTAPRGDPAARGRRSVRHHPPVRRPGGHARRSSGSPARRPSSSVRPSARDGTSWWPARRARARPPCSTRCRRRSRTPNGSSPSRRRRSCGSRNRTWCGSRRGRRTPRGSVRSRSASWCGPRSGCAPTAWSSARSAAREALDMLQALNTGHDGSMSTIHANGAVRCAGPARDPGAPRRFRAAARRGSHPGGREHRRGRVRGASPRRRAARRGDRRGRRA